MKKKSKPGPNPPPPPKNYLGVWRAARLPAPVGPIPCFWGEPFIVVVIERNGHMKIGSQSSGGMFGGSWPARFVTEKEASDYALKTARFNKESYAVLDLTGLGPREIEVEQ